MNLRFVWASLKESRILENIASKHVRSLPLLIPIYRSGSRGRFTVYFGAFLYYLLGLMSGGARAPRILWNRQAVQTILPTIQTRELTGGVIIWDRITDDRRLVCATVASAQRAGAEALEGAAVKFYAREEEYGYRVAVGEGDRFFYGRKIVNASGPWIDSLRESSHDPDPKFILPIAGSHIEFEQFVPMSCILEAEDGRVFFVINTNGVSRVGTTERLHENPDTVQPTDEEKKYLLRSLKHFFPSVMWDEKKALKWEAGIRPLLRPKKEMRATDVSREHKLVRCRDGVLHLVGVKLTDHRRAAKETVDVVMRELPRERSRGLSKSSTDRSPLLA